MSAGAGQFDEFNRPLDTFDKLLPATRGKLQTPQAVVNGGISIARLKPLGAVTQGNATIQILAWQQSFDNLKPSNQVRVIARFKDGKPAALDVKVGKGQIVAQGYLPALDYIYEALTARTKHEEAQPDEPNTADTGIPTEQDVVHLDPSQKSYNPWEYPAKVRDAIVAPALAANLDLPVKCSVPLVDAVYMTSDKGVVIPLANYTLMPIKAMTLTLAVDHTPSEVRSVHQGVLKTTRVDDKHIRVTLPLECTDYITIKY
jgi:hypothetical protein